MGDQAAISPALSSFVRRLRRRYRVERIILFGSRARGDALRDSDTDVVIVSPNFQTMDFTTRVAAVLDLWKGRTDLEPLCLTPEEFDRKRRAIGIVREAVREGVEL